MLFPILGFVLGVFLLVVTISIYQGGSLLKSLPLIGKLMGSLLFLGGNSLISLAAILGLAGYWNLFNGSDLKLARIILLLIGLAMSSWSLLEVVEDDSPLGKLKSLASPEKLAIFLTGISIITLFSLFLVAFLTAIAAVMPLCTIFPLPLECGALFHQNNIPLNILQSIVI